MIKKEKIPIKRGKSLRKQNLILWIWVIQFAHIARSRLGAYQTTAFPKEFLDHSKGAKQCKKQCYLHKIK